MRDYAEAARSFAYADAVGTALQGNLKGLNACVECCDRHAGEGKTALVWEDREGNSVRLSFDQLQALAARFANVLEAQGVGAGDRVAGEQARGLEGLAVLSLGIRADPDHPRDRPEARSHPRQADKLL